VTESYDEAIEEPTPQEKRDRAVEEAVAAWPPSGGEQVATIIGLLRSVNR
jgi:hypothetical protein